MTSKFLLSISSRDSDTDCLDVTFSFGFIGRNVDRPTVARCFTDKLETIARTLGTETVHALDELSTEASDAAIRQAISDALDKVDAAHREELIERYNLAAEGL